MRLPTLLGGARQAIFIRLIANGIAQAIAMVGSALLIQRAVDQYVVTAPPAQLTDMQLLWIYIACLIAIGLVAAGLRMFERIDAERLGQSYAFSVRRRLFDQLCRFTPRALASRRHGDTMLRFVGDLGALRRWLSMGLARLASAGLLIGITFAVLAVLNLPLAITVSSALGLAILFTLLIGAPLEAAIRELRQKRTRLANNIAEKTAAMVVVQAHGQLQRERRRLRRQNLLVRAAFIRRAFFIGGLRAISESSIRISVALALLVGAYQVASGAATAGTVVAAMSIVAFLAAPIRDLSRVYDYWYAARVSREKLSKFLGDTRIVREPRHPRTLKNGSGRLEFRNVTVKATLKRINATVQEGQFTLLTGPNGAGKSTLIWLAARLIDPDSGSVLLDGQDVRKLAGDELRQQIGIVSSDIPLLRGSVLRNIRYRRPNISTKELRDICSLCGIDALLKELPGGRSAQVSAGGRNLSHGQRQQIAIARALAGSPRLLLLDEPDAGLDLNARHVLQWALENFAGTVLMVSHDPGWIARAGSVWSLADGGLSTSVVGDNAQPHISAPTPRLVAGGSDCGG